MATPSTGPRGANAVSVDSRRLWTGGLATACVAALAAWIGVLLGQGVLDVSLGKTAVVLGLTTSRCSTTRSRRSCWRSRRRGWHRSCR